MNIPEIRLGIVAVSRDCSPITFSEKRRAAIVAEYRKLEAESEKSGGDNDCCISADYAPIYECPVTVENEKDVLKALADVEAFGCNALVIFLGNFGPETLIAQKFQ